MPTCPHLLSGWRVFAVLILQRAVQGLLAELRKATFLGLAIGTALLQMSLDIAEDQLYMTKIESREREREREKERKKERER